MQKKVIEVKSQCDLCLVKTTMDPEWQIGMGRWSKSGSPENIWETIALDGVRDNGYLNQSSSVELMKSGVLWAILEVS